MTDDTTTTRTVESIARMEARIAELIRERDEAAQVARDVVFRRMLEHPLPWHVERDWTHEVIAADGAIVAKCSGDARAAAVIALAERIRAELDATEADLCECDCADQGGR